MGNNGLTIPWDNEPSGINVRYEKQASILLAIEILGHLWDTDVENRRLIHRRGTCELPRILGLAAGAGAADGLERSVADEVSRQCPATKRLDRREGLKPTANR